MGRSLDIFYDENTPLCIWNRDLQNRNTFKNLYDQFNPIYKWKKDRGIKDIVDAANRLEKEVNVKNYGSCCSTSLSTLKTKPASEKKKRSYFQCLIDAEKARSALEYEMYIMAME